MAHAAVGQLTQEVVNDLLLLLASLLGLLELVVVDNAGDDFLLLYVEIVLPLLKGLSQLLPVFECPFREALPFLSALLPRLDFLAELYILLLDEFHVEGPAQVLLLLVPLVKHGIDHSQVKSEVS